MIIATIKISRTQFLFDNSAYLLIMNVHLDISIRNDVYYCQRYGVAHEFL